MTGIAAMAVSNEIPEAAEWIDMVSRATTDWANFQGDILQNKPANFDNGAYYESVSYANYGLTQYLTFRLAMQNFNPRKGSYLSVQQIILCIPVILPTVIIFLPFILATATLLPMVKES